MRRFIAVLVVTLAVSACADTALVSPLSPDIAPSMSLGAGGTCTLANGSVVATGFDNLGYNRCAKLFNGPADGTDKVLDGKVWGDPTYAKDHLKMKWNSAWDACNANRNPANCAGAWTDNQWNGMVPGGSGETWHYKIKWVGPCATNRALVPRGGYCVWNEYAVVLSHGTANQHFWDAHARPAGYGN